MDKILTYLRQLDLSDIEAKLYLTLLQTGPISVRDLAATVAIKRTTTYLYIDQLVEKGLILKIVKGAKKQVAANSPESLEHLVEEKLEKAKAAQKDFPNIMKALHEIEPEKNDTSESEIKYYKGKQGVKKIYEEALSTKKEIRSYVNIEEIAEVFPENVKLFDTAFKNSPTMKMFEIVENSPEARKRFEASKKRERYFYKFLPEGMKLTAQDIIIYENRVAIIHFRDKINGIVLQNIDLYQNFKLLFDFMWQTLPEYNHGK